MYIYFILCRYSKNVLKFLLSYDVHIVKSLFHIFTGLFCAACLVLTKIDAVTVRGDRSVTVFELLLPFQYNVAIRI